MLVFVTAIKHPNNSANFRRVEQLLEISLRSICSQTDPEFRVVVVCNVKPQVAFDDDRIVYHSVDYPAPASKGQTAVAYNAYVRDKGTKLLAGALLGQQFKPDYFGMVDSDDLVSRRLVAFANANIGKAGWYTDAGYVVNYKTWRTQRKYGLVRYCGTALVPNAADLFRLCKIDKSLDHNAKQQDLLDAVSPTLVDHLFGDHPYMAGFFAKHGLYMKPVPFRASAWVLENGENQTPLREKASGLPVSEWFCQEFGVCNPPHAHNSSSLLDRLHELFSTGISKLGSLRYRVKGFPDLPQS
ncbi:MAG TPA: glycosyltransferase family A protein [Gemmataceae bacterium]|nr:glycosyltransferase family A protein [Gemmataceae bacterium]